MTKQTASINWGYVESKLGTEVTEKTKSQLEERLIAARAGLQVGQAELPKCTKCGKISLHCKCEENELKK